MEFGILNPIAKLLIPRLIKGLREWDLIAAQRPDLYIANSKNTQERITKYYKRKSEVIYPGIDTSLFAISKSLPLHSVTSTPFDKGRAEGFYLSVGRCIPYKKFELLVDTFNQNGKKLILVTNTDNKLYKKLKAKSKTNIEWKL